MMANDVTDLYRPGISLSCPQCDQPFESHESFKSHMDEEHGDSKPYHCDQCDKCYGVRMHLVEHIKRIHLEERRYECAECKKQFYNKREMTKHCVTHQQNLAVDINDDVYRPGKSLICTECSDCSVSFDSHPDYINHMKTRHNVIAPYRCSICRKGYKRRDRLIIHMKLKHLHDKSEEGLIHESPSTVPKSADSIDSKEIRNCSENGINEESSLSSEFELFSDDETADIHQNDNQSIVKDSDQEFLEYIQNWDNTECCVCHSKDSTTDNSLLRCDGCDVVYHTLCVGLESISDDLFWFCSKCQHLEFDLMQGDKEQTRGLEIRLASLTITDGIKLCSDL